ncbi:TetR/AcrR family transcriptional regulator [Paenibacillus sp. KN14-4R]|uniref:TetR/AcrR family transcriptional regulator n=1 Tax=Paenibacillus sp. KN14-4R TaxID=3445773 RepID=UPI003F9F5F7F
MLRVTRKQQLKNEIFNQAMMLFKEKGFDNVTIEEITQACGIAKGTFYNYFSKKEALLLHLGMMQLESVNESIQRHSAIPDLKQKLILLFRDLMMNYDEQPDMVRPVISELMRSGLFMDEELGIIHTFRNTLKPLLDNAYLQGQLPEKTVTGDVASVLIGTYFNSLMFWLSTDGQNKRFEDIFQRHFDIVWAGIRPERS